jgi:hypothetical protein
VGVCLNKNVILNNYTWMNSYKGLIIDEFKSILNLSE